MKKAICVLAALLLLTVFPCLALADGLYEKYGPTWEWGEDEWLAAEEWNEAQWDEYYQGMEEAEELEYLENRRQERIKLGCPDPDGVNVKLNAAYLLFPEVKPQIIDDAIYLPLRAFFGAAALEADFSYDAASRSVTVTCKDGAILFLTADEDLIIITKPGEEPWERYAYYEPLIMDSRMYVEEADICSVLGWDSFWDYYNQILYIVDPEPLIEAVNSGFSIINRLLNSNMDLDMEQSFKFAGRAMLSGVLYGDEKNDNISAAFSYEGLRKGLGIDMNYSLQLDLKQMQDSVFAGFDEETWRIIKALDTCKGRLILNNAEEACYLQSNLLALFDEKLSAKDWLMFDYPVQELDMLLSGDIFLEQIQGLSLGWLIYESSNGYSYDERDVYAKTMENTKLCQDLLGDRNFTTQLKGGYNVYTLKIAKKTLPGLSISPFSVLGFGYDENMAELSGQLQFKEKDGNLVDMQIKATAQTAGAFPITFTLDYSCNSTKYQFSLEIKGRYLGKLLLDAEYEAKPTTELPALAPPEGSNVVDVEDPGFSPIRILLKDN